MFLNFYNKSLFFTSMVRIGIGLRLGLSLLFPVLVPLSVFQMKIFCNRSDFVIHRVLYTK